MPTAVRVLLLTVLAGTNVAAAQDSVSRNANGGNGLPGDALSPWTAGANQRTSYIVDLTTIETSTGVPFGIAPILKSGKVSTARFSALNGSSAISASVNTAVPYPAASYALWSSPGGGVNTTENDTSLNSIVSPAGVASVLGVGFMDFEDVTVGTTAVFTNQLYAGLLAFNPGQPSRLFVTRINAAVNANSGQLDRSQFGFGGIDADGNLCFRADSFGSTGVTSSLLVGDNFFRIRSLARSTSVNVIDNNGGTNSAATDWVLVRNTVTHATPSLVPAGLTGRSIVLGADFLGQYRYENTVNATTVATSHRPLTTDHRGGVGFSARPVFVGSVGTAGLLTRSTGGGGKTDSLSLWGIDASGAVMTTRTLTMPAAIIDGCDAFSWPLGGGDFRNYDSQVLFRGGSSPVAIGGDASGYGLAAAVLYNGMSLSPANPYNAIAAVRFDPNVPASTPQWTAAAWVDSAAQTGKSIRGDFGLDGAPGTGDIGENDGVVNANDAPIGRLASLPEGGGGEGPSLSAPTFDSAGNIYFVASTSLRRQIGQSIQSVYGVSLIRGVYDASTFCYELEVLLDFGSVIGGANAGLPYQVQGLNLADSDSISTASIWSGSANQLAWNNENTSGFPTSDPRHLGGLVLSARIVYDVDNSGVFQDPTGTGGNVLSSDEAYNVILYIGNITPLQYCGSADFDGDGDVGTDLDIEEFFAALGGNPCATCGSVDFDGDGDVGTDADIEAFFRVLGGGTC